MTKKVKITAATKEKADKQGVDIEKVIETALDGIVDPEDVVVETPTKKKETIVEEKVEEVEDVQEIDEPVIEQKTETTTTETYPVEPTKKETVKTTVVETEEKTGIEKEAADMNMSVEEFRQYAWHRLGRKI